MKKMLLLLAGMACLGMFVSCSDDPQEVVVTNRDSGVARAGTAEGTVVYTSSSSYSAKITSDGLSKISYTDYANVNTDMKDYYLEVPVTRTYTGDSPSYESVEIHIVKVGNDYYNDRDGKMLDVTGSPESKEFTIASIETYSYKFTNLKFTRM